MFSLSSSEKDFEVSSWKNQTDSTMDYYSNEIQQLKFETKQLQGYIDNLQNKYERKIKELQAQLKELINENYDLKEQNIYIESQRRQDQQIQQQILFNANISQQNRHFSQQLEILLNEVQKLNDILQNKSLQVIQLEQQNQHIQSCMRILEENYDNLIMKTDMLSDQNKQYQYQIDQLNREKKELMNRVSDGQIVMQKLNVELQCQKSFYDEQFKQLKLQELIHEEIKKTQIQRQHDFIQF
ncbi:hypothetical protein pb186bvf_000550 [Paramecium bursaria]